MVNVIILVNVSPMYVISVRSLLSGARAMVMISSSAYVTISWLSSSSLCLYEARLRPVSGWLACCRRPQSYCSVMTYHIVSVWPTYADRIVNQ